MVQLCPSSSAHCSWVLILLVPALTLLGQAGGVSSTSSTPPSPPGVKSGESDGGMGTNSIVVSAESHENASHILRHEKDSSASDERDDAPLAMSDAGVEGHSSNIFEREADEEEQDRGDSDVSEERNPEDIINNGQLTPVSLDVAGEQRRPDDVVSVIDNAFNNRKTFSCPKIKDDFVTGTSTANLSPEDIGIMAAMGDSLATGAGLWSGIDIEFRGAAFPIGGDATIDGLVTVPNILREFAHQNKLHGVSHGMGKRDQLPLNQLNVALPGASSSSMPEQARELVRRVAALKEVDIYDTWAMVIIVVGTEEICSNCTGPNTEALIEALNILLRGMQKCFVVLIGPIHVSSSYHQKANLLKNRCECSREKSNEVMLRLSEEWAASFAKVQSHVERAARRTFNILTLPMLTVTSRYPYSLFVPNRPLLNRRGHNYAAKWLWNTLVAGPKYNLSRAVLSQDAYFCPSLGCPYFRTTENYNYCSILSHREARARKELEAELNSEEVIGRKRTNLYLTALVIVSIAFVVVLSLGTFFYQRSKKGNKGRFDQMPAVTMKMNGERLSTRTVLGAAEKGELGDDSPTVATPLNSSSS